MSMIEDKEEWEDTIERMVGIYRVLKPHLISHYSAHIEAANPVYEPPTLRILAQLVEEEKRHVERGSFCSTNCSTRRRSIAAPRDGNPIWKNCSRPRAASPASNATKRK